MKTTTTNTLRSPLISIHARGWTVRSIAKELGVNAGHVSRVINGERKSKSLITRINNLPDREVTIYQRKK